MVSILESCREQDQDLILIPENGLPVITHSLNLSLHSPSLRTLLSSLPPSSPHSLSIPAPYSTLTNLLKLIIKGQVKGNSRQELEQVKELAKVLDILLGDCQVGSRRQVVRQEKEEHEEEHVEEQIGGTIKEEVGTPAPNVTRSSNVKVI